MNDDRYQRVKEIFLEVCEQRPEQRLQMLEALCADDAELRAAVERLLEQDDSAPSDELTGQAGNDFDPAALAWIGRTLSHYRIRGVIASGGMGTVFEAVQEQPRRTVALKVMRQGIASRSALRRFEYEAQILGRLRHPGIAQIYEAGVHYEESAREGGEGIPFFAMEYVPGAKPINDYVREAKLPVRDRLVLFAQVCDAVQCGHQQGIIHRDLKPTNILVDSSGRPKVIDFGVARATDADLAVTTVQTSIGQLIGTVQYMSPEQCAADPHDIDIRSDVYSLGVVLYELLAGRPPYDIAGASILQATRAIIESPAARLSATNRTLRGDVETIVSKALEKDRHRRYQTAGELGQDIRRFLDNQPITACPPSTMYVLRKFVRRNKAPVAALTAIFVVLTASLIGVSLALRGTHLARLQAEHARDDAELARDEAEEVTRFLETTLASVSPEELGRDVLVRDVMHRAAETLAEGMSGRPRLEARLRHTIGRTLMHLGDYDASLSHLRRAFDLRAAVLGPNHRDTFVTRNAIGETHYKRHDFTQAEKIFRETLDARRRLFGEDDPQTLESVTNMFVVLMARNRRDEARPFIEQAVEGFTRVLGPDDPNTLYARNNLGALHYALGELDDAETIFRDVLARRERILGPDHPQTLDSMNNLAMLLRGRGRLEEAQSLLERTVEIRREKQGPSHPQTLDAIANLVGVAIRRDAWIDAERSCAALLDGRLEALGPGDVRTLRTRVLLARTIASQGRWEDARAASRLAYDECREHLGPDNLDTLAARREYARTLLNLDRLDDAEDHVDDLVGRFLAMERVDLTAELLHDWRTAARRLHGADHARAEHLLQRHLDRLIAEGRDTLAAQLRERLAGG